VKRATSRLPPFQQPASAGRRLRVRYPPMRLLIALSVCAASCAHGHDHGTGGDSRADRERIETGAGSWCFESVPGWAKLDKPLGPTHGGIVIDREGRIYVATDGQAGIAVFAPDGAFLRSLPISGIHSMVLRDEGGEEFIYAAHLAGRQAVKLKLDGTVVWKLGWKAGWAPTAVAVAPDGSIFVADGYGSSHIHKFDPERRHVKTFAGAGTKPGQCRTCHGIVIDARGPQPLLLVCDRENRRLSHFDLDGNFVATIARGLRRPCAVAFFKDGMAVAELEGRVTVFDSKNRVVSRLGDNPDRGKWANFDVPPAQWSDSLFTAPHGLCFDRDGNLFVQDWNRTGRVTKLRRMPKAHPTSAPDRTPLDRTGWTAAADSAQPGNDAARVLDGDEFTIWHTEWSPASPLPPHEIRIDLGAEREFSALGYLPRQEGGPNGTIAEYEIHAGDALVASGRFKGATDEEFVDFKPVRARVVRLVAKSEVNGKAWASAAELNLYR